MIKIINTIYNTSCTKYLYKHNYNHFTTFIYVHVYIYTYIHIYVYIHKLKSQNIRKTQQYRKNYNGRNYYAYIIIQKTTKLVRHIRQESRKYWKAQNTISGSIRRVIRTVQFYNYV
jgi:hypothetical protein